MNTITHINLHLYRKEIQFIIFYIFIGFNDDITVIANYDYTKNHE